jgi:NTE family protein
VRYLVLCGGGSRGAIEVGFARALWEAGVRFDGIVGSSVGALNGAFLASGGHPDELAEIWRSLHFHDIFRFNWRILLRGFREASVFTVGPRIRRLLSRHAGQRFEDLALPFVVVATDLATGEPVAITAGPLLPAVTASIAIPGLLPPVTWGGRHLVDGSLSANLPVAEAVRRGATEIWAMRCACCAEARRRFDGLPDILAQLFGFAVDRTAHREAQALQGLIAHIWSPDAALHVTALDFSHSGRLIEEAYRFTRDRLGELAAAGPTAFTARAENRETSKHVAGG